MENLGASLENLTLEKEKPAIGGPDIDSPLILVFLANWDRFPALSLLILDQPTMVD